MATKPPTSTDLKIYAHLQAGHKINHLQAVDLFRTTGLRDTIYRLGKAGYLINRETVYYRNSEGKLKHFVNYFLLPVESEAA